MVKRTGPTNVNLRNLIKDLNSLGTKEKVKLWKRVASELSKSTRQRRNVNLDTINKSIRAGEVALVPGKVLSDGELTKKVDVAAWKFSEAAKLKINKTGKTMTLRELMKTNPKGKKVRILG